jgi:hypothetical protein
VPVPTDERREGQKIVITTTHIISANGWLLYIGSFVNAEGKVSLRQVKRGRPIRLSARKFLKAGEITVRVSGGDNERTGYLTFRTTTAPMAIELSEDGGHTKKFVRCFLLGKDPL